MTRSPCLTASNSTSTTITSMSTAADGNGYHGNGVIPKPESSGPLVVGGMALAGSPLDLAELERLANEMFRAGPEGAGLSAETAGVSEAGAEEAISQIPGMNGLSLNGARDGSAAKEVLA